MCVGRSNECSLQGASMTKSDEQVVLVHSSDLHVSDEQLPGFYSGLLGLRAVLAAAKDVNADVLLLAGDTFDNGRVSDGVLGEATAMLAAAPMPVVLLPGNHDSIMPECLYRRAGLIGLPNVHVLGITRSEERRVGNECRVRREVY